MISLSLSNALNARSLVPEIEPIATRRIADMTDGEDYDPDLHGLVVVVEPGDTIEQLERELGCSILQDAWDGTRFGDDRFTPNFELLEEHRGFYELVIVPGDGDFGVVIFIPKQDGINTELLHFCETYATAAP